MLISLLLSALVSTQAPTELGRLLVAQAPSAPSRPAWRPDAASDVLAHVHAFYKGTKDLKAEFVQTYTNRKFGTTTIAKGRLKVKRPDMMLWDYAGKADHDIHIAGQEAWVVEHDTRQVVQSTLKGRSDVSAALDFMFGQDDVLRGFKVRYSDDARSTRYGDRDHHVIELKPKRKNPHYKGLVLVVHAISGRVDQFMVYNQDGSTSRFELSKIRTNTRINASQFKVSVPRGYVMTKS